MVVPRRQHEFNRVSQSIHNSVQFCIQPASGSSNCLICRFFPSIGTFVNHDAGGIQTKVFHIRICGQRTKYGLQCAVIPPFGKSGVHRLPGAIRLQQFPPLCSAVGNPKHPIEHFSIIFPRTAPLSRPFWRKHSFHSLPLFFCQFISFHVPIFALTYGLCIIYFSYKA